MAPIDTTHLSLPSDIPPTDLGTEQAPAAQSPARSSLSGEQRFPEPAPKRAASPPTDDAPAMKRLRIPVPARPEREQIGISALDLALAATSAAIGPRSSADTEIKLDKLFFTAAELTAVQAPGTSEGASTQAAHYRADNEGNRYRLKFNKDRPQVTFCDVFVPRFLESIGFPDEPAAAFVCDPHNQLGKGAGAVWIASPELPGFKDVGAFLVESGIHHVEPDLRAAYTQHLDNHTRQMEQVQALIAQPEIKALLERYPKGGFDQLDESEHTLLQPLRDCYLKALQAQDKMLPLLPPVFSRLLLRKFYMNEIIGNWDFENHDRANTGYTVNNGTVRVHTVDFGNSGPIGYGGKFKHESGKSAMQPARVDEPAARIPNKLMPSGYGQSNFFLEQDLHFETVSRTFGGLGQLPRSSVLGGLLAPVIVAEREHDPSDGRPHTAPDEALEIAWHLTQLPPDRGARFTEQMFEQGLNHPDYAIRRLFSKKYTGYPDGAALAHAYQQRIDGIIARAQEGGQLERWAARNPERAAEISAHVTRTLGNHPQGRAAIIGAYALPASA